MNRKEHKEHKETPEDAGAMRVGRSGPSGAGRFYAFYAFFVVGSISVTGEPPTRQEGRKIVGKKIRTASNAQAAVGQLG
ncbi:MAG: hypothetical protein JXQ71_14930 [Verrucomicrobia bacterium]|nr:hypothetical protein [Verrucomicrobiota bacterium]